MRITIKIESIEIVLDEGGLNDRSSSLKFKDQSEHVHTTLRVMTNECLKLYEVSLKSKTCQF